MSTQTTLHPFYETLGEGPYRFVGCYDLGAALDPTSAANFGNMTGWLSAAPQLKGGLGTCSHCGKGILNICIVRVGNGDLYGVGEDCVEKCSTGGIWKGAKAALAARRNAMARERKRVKAAAKWEAERPAREKRDLEENARIATENTPRKAKRIANFEKFNGVLEALVGADKLAKWRSGYEAENGYPYGFQASFNPLDAFSFNESIASQLIENGYLSPRQASCVCSYVIGRNSKKNESALIALYTTLITNP